MNNSGQARGLPLVVHIAAALTIGMVIAFVPAAAFVVRYNVVHGVAVAPSAVTQVTSGQREVYMEISDAAHEAWKSPDPTQSPEPIVNHGSILMLNAGILRDSRDRIPEYCDVAIGGEILKLAPTHNGFIAVKYIEPSIESSIFDVETCEDGTVTLMNDDVLRYFNGP